MNQDNIVVGDTTPSMSFHCAEFCHPNGDYLRFCILFLERLPDLNGTERNALDSYLALTSSPMISVNTKLG
jgi:hypothetical protein